MLDSRPKAAILLIGDELLSGKIRDENGWFLTRVCRRRGIELREIAVVPDEVETIGAALLRLLRDAPLIFTSGGVGPTHDDMTMEAIAQATARPLVRNAKMEALLREHYDESIDSALRMADVPEGTSLRALPGWPVMRLDLRAGETFPSFEGALAHDSRIYILPGIPALLQAKVETLETLPDELPRAREWTLVEVHTHLDESRIAPLLNTIVDRFPAVEIGSYPRWTPDEDGRLRVRVKLTFEAEDGARAESAAAEFRAAVDPDDLIAPP